MIHPIKEEIYIALYLILFSIYIISSYDILLLIFKRIKIKKWLKIFIEIIYFIIQTIITYYFSYNLAYGYIPIYFILFVILGMVFYLKIIRKPFIKIVDKIIAFLSKILNKLFKYIVHLIYSKTLFIFIKNIFKKIKFKKNEDKENISLE